MTDAPTASPPKSPPGTPSEAPPGQAAAPIRVEGRSASGTAPAPACTLVIFGADGDLTRRLLVPALYNLAGSGLLDDATRIIGVDRNATDAEGWRAALSRTMQSFTTDMAAEFHTKRIDPQAWGWVRQRLDYLQGDFGQPALYDGLARQLTGNVVFYLAIADRFFGPVTDRLGAAGLLNQATGFRRVVIEKPFGRDLATAQALNRRIQASADESQFYRIDHFLGKETVQNILAIRFANPMFEPIWCRDHIDHVQITVAETIGVERRGAFYEPTGAVRDMIPNHLFQLLCMTAMEPPDSLEAEAVRTAKARLVQAVRPIDPADAARGQYRAGTLLGHPVQGYRAEDAVAPDSDTETYAAIRLMIDNPRWAGVPFYLRTGKCLTARRTEIAIQFRPTGCRLFRNADGGPPAANILRLQIDPVQGTETIFNAKIPGPVLRLGRVTTTFRYQDFFAERPNVGYETLLYDCMRGDATLFQRADNIEAGWAVVDPLLRAWAEGDPEGYAAGSAGPSAADALLARDGRHWLPLAPEGAPQWIS